MGVGRLNGKPADSKSAFRGSNPRRPAKVRPVTTKEERAIVEEINDMRANPWKYKGR